MTDPVADMLTRLRNAYMAGHDSVEIPYSNLKEQVAKILVSEGYIASLSIEKQKPQNKMLLELIYYKKLPAIDAIKRISKPGRRIYARSDKIPKTLGGVGLTILSTSKGIMSGKQATKEKLGGEVICQVW
jgi:small subunit ribosomal protein S8